MITVILPFYIFLNKIFIFGSLTGAVAFKTITKACRVWIVIDINKLINLMVNT